MDLALIIDRISDMILVFFMLGGWPYALAALAMLVISWKRNWIQLLAFAALSFAMLAALWAWRAPQIREYNVQDQIYATYFLWGALFYLTLVFLLSIAIKVIRLKLKPKPPEHS